MNREVAILIPTYNAGSTWSKTLESIDNQSINTNNKLIIDSSSIDETCSLARKHGFKVKVIHPSEFDHGGTRQKLIDLCPEIDFAIFLTQDAILADKESLNAILAVFEDEKVGMAYGRQLPHINAQILEAHARLFNYPEKAILKNKGSIPSMGFKTVFCSNSFAAYRIEALKDVGGLPEGNIMGEDTITAAKMILKDWEVAYVASARVFHSHSYTMNQEFKRSFDIGVFHAQNQWMVENFSTPQKEGLKFVMSEIKFATRRNIFVFFEIFPRTIAKLLGYKLGLNYKRIPISIIPKLSMHKNFWKK